MQMKTTFLTTQGCGAISRSGGFVPVAQQNRSTAGLQQQVIELPASLAVPSVLAGLLADATHCKRSTLTQPQSGTMRKTNACPATTLLALIVLFGGPAPNVATGNKPSILAQMGCTTGLEGCDAFNKGKLLILGLLTLKTVLSGNLSCPGDASALTVHFIACADEH